MEQGIGEESFGYFEVSGGRKHFIKLDSLSNVRIVKFQPFFGKVGSTEQVHH